MKSLVLAGCLALVGTHPALAEDPFELGGEDEAPAAQAAPTRPAMSMNCDTAAQEMGKALAKGASAARGVLRHYDIYVGQDCPDYYHAHFMAAQAFRLQGDVGGQVNHLAKARKACEAFDGCPQSVTDSYKAEVDDVYRRFNSTYLTISKKESKSCRKKLEAGEGVPAVLTRPAGLPFAPDEIAAISFANKKLCVDGSFGGFLPVGSYEVAGEPIPPITPKKTGRL